MGWVLESQGKVVGFIGNIPRRYLFGGSEWIAGVARSFVVDEDFRGRSTKLLWQFISQKGQDDWFIRDVFNYKRMVHL